MIDEEKRTHVGLGILRDAYLANEIRQIKPYLAENCEYGSFFSTDDEHTKEGVIEVLNNRFERSASTNGKYFRFAMVRMPTWQFGPLQSYYPETEVLISMSDEANPQVMLKIEVDVQGLIKRIQILPPDFFSWEYLEEGDQYHFDELYTLALDEASTWMQAKGFLELFREERRLSYPNLVVYDDGKPMEIAVIPVRFPFLGSINTSYREIIARSMCPGLKQLAIFVQFKNNMDPEKPWNLKRGDELECLIRDEPLEIEFVETEVNESEFEA